MKITDNISLRKYVEKMATKEKTTMEAIKIKISEAIHCPLNTVKGWLHPTKYKPITARNAALIQDAIDRGEL